VIGLIFVGLSKFRKKPDKKDIGDTTKIIAEWKAKGINMLNWYWTLGRYDAVVVLEAPSEKEVMKIQHRRFPARKELNEKGIRT